MTIYVDENMWNKIKEADEKELTNKELESIKEFKRSTTELMPYLVRGEYIYETIVLINAYKTVYYKLMHEDTPSHWFYELNRILK